jgi:hypothetical protein
MRQSSRPSTSLRTGAVMIDERCASCAHFRNDPAYLETLFAGMSSLSSAYGSACGDDGHCVRHDRYLGARSRCADFQAAALTPAR